MPSARSRVRNHSVACAPCHRPISSCRRRDVQQWATAPSQHRAPGTVYSTRSFAAHRWPPSNALWKLTFILSAFSNTFITLRPCFVTFVNWPWSDFFICDTLKLANLHYIMVFYSVQADIFDYATESLNNIITVTKNLIFPLAFSWFVLNSPKVLWQLPNYLDFQNDPAFPSKWLP